MSRREKIIGIIMMVVLLIWGSKFLQKEKKNLPKKGEQVINKPKQETDKIQKGEGASSVDLNDVIESLKLEFKEEDAVFLRDPFKKVEIKPNTDALTFSDLVLTGIMWEEGKAAVVINDQILQVGDVIAGFQLMRISREEVLLTNGEERNILRLFSSSQEKKGEGDQQ